MNEDQRKREKTRIGQELHEAIKPVLERHKARGLQAVCAFTLNKPGDPGLFDITTVSTIEDPKVIVIVLAGAAREIKEKMIDPFYLPRRGN